MRVPVFTARSVGIGVAAGMLVAVALGQLVGSAWGLAVLTGLAAGALALAVSVITRDGRFDCLGTMTTERRIGLWILAWIVIFAPASLVENFVLPNPDSPDNELALKVLLLTSGLAAYALGGIMATLSHLDGDAPAEPRLHRVTPPPGERKDAP